MNKITLCLAISCLILAPAGRSQTTHPLLLNMQQKAAAVPFGSYRLTVKEHYRHQQDTSQYFATCAFYRFRQADDAPALRFELQLEGHAGGSVHQQRVVFDGVEKFDFRGDSLAMIYNIRDLGAEFTFRGLQNYFFVPILLHDGLTRRFLGPDKSLGTPHYQTRPDTLLDGAICHLVVAEWVADSTTENVQHLAFFLDPVSGLARRFIYVESALADYHTRRILHYFEIKVEEFTTELPHSSFYVDWPSLPGTVEVRRYIDCQMKELVRARLQQPGL